MRPDVGYRNHAKAKNNNVALIGAKYNSLTIIRFEHRGKSWYWRCKCDCGKETVCAPYKVTSGHTKTCGCGKVARCHKMTEKYRIKHGGRNERLYHIWRGMKQRCCDPLSKDYTNWGGRGITICEDWLNDYSAFREWAFTNGYDDTLTIDRIDVNGDYCPDNCRWISQKEQARNKRETVYVELNGVKKSLIAWCEEFGLNYQTVYGRIHHYGWSVYDALNIPVGEMPRKESRRDKCERYNVSYSTVQYRINKLGWDEERAFATPVRTCKRKEVV